MGARWRVAAVESEASIRRLGCDKSRRLGIALLRLQSRGGTGCLQLVVVVVIDDEVFQEEQSCEGATEVFQEEQSCEGATQQSADFFQEICIKR